MVDVNNVLAQQGGSLEKLSLYGSWSSPTALDCPFPNCLFRPALSKWRRLFLHRNRSCKKRGLNYVGKKTSMLGVTLAILGIDFEFLLKCFLAFSCVIHLMRSTGKQRKPFILSKSTFSNCAKVLSTPENIIHELERYEINIKKYQQVIKQCRHTEWYDISLRLRPATCNCLFTAGACSKKWTNMICISKEENL